MLGATNAVTNDNHELFSEDDVHDYVDNRMSPDRRQKFEKFLETNEEIAELVEDYKRQNELLKALFSHPDSVSPRRRNGSNGSHSE